MNKKTIPKTSIILVNLFFLLFTAISSTKADNHSIENQISNYINTYQQEQLNLLEKLVNINSGTTNISGVYQTGELLRPQFQALGFKVYWIDVPTKLKRAGTLVAEYIGTSKKRLLLIGHLDTVFPASSSFLSFKHEGNFATGPGVIDNKGGIVIILYALKALHAAEVLHGSTITVVLTGDEEDVGEPIAVSRKPLIDMARHSDIALDFDWAFSLDTATIARRGISHWLIKAEGQEAYSSQIFNEGGFGAAYELARILNDARIQLANENNISFNPGLILGGTFKEGHSKGTVFGKENVIAKTAIAQGDLRFLTSEQKDKVEKSLAAIVEDHLPGTTAFITFQDKIPAMQPTKANLALLQQYSKASQKLGFGIVNPLDPGLREAGAISYIAMLVSSSLAGLGPVGMGAHSTKETLDTSSLSIQTQRAALLIYWLSYSDDKN